ncbi:hypothetical protein ACAF76_004380 [Brevibacillus sp. TJ4]|uniref:hypothetical protein n=1 Tax=Brevibacillus sp. TJ4 TaxID=3234853 RepID=UPI0037D851A7
MLQERLLIKHAVGGRTFIDTSIEPADYRLEQSEHGWKLVLHRNYDEIMAEICKWKDELNLFLFLREEGEPEKKIWFYVEQGAVSYDSEQQRLTIVGTSRIEYVPERFGEMG